jgi:pilus assembly protein CpaE
MSRLKIAIFAPDQEQLGILQVRLNRTMCGHCVFGHSQATPLLSDSLLHEVRAVAPDVALIALGSAQPAQRVACIESVRSALPSAAVLAVGPMDPRLIVMAMRAGGREYLEEHFSDANLLEALSRLAASREQEMTERSERGKLYAVFSAKGGSGGTTVAVNLAVALKERVHTVALVDLATLGHTPLHLDARPVFGMMDAVQNLHRLDRALLESFMASSQNGVRLLAGPGFPGMDFPAQEVARVLEVLTSYYPCTVVDCSTRCDAVARAVYQRCDSALLVTQSDAVSLWSVAHVREFLVEGSDPDKLHLALNRFRTAPTMPDKDIEAITQTPIYCKIPNQFNVVANAIDRGAPAGNGNSELARCFRELAAQLLPQQGYGAALGNQETKKERPSRILERLLNLNPAR